MRNRKLWEAREQNANTNENAKQYKYLYRKMLDENIIRKAYKKLRKGKTKRKEIQYIDEHLDEEVQKMHDMIENTKPPDVEVEHPELAYSKTYIDSNGQEQRNLILLCSQCHEAVHANDRHKPREIGFKNEERW